MNRDPDDIVTSLRDTACCWRGTDPIAIELRQAADEIERLRAELQTNNSRLRARDEYAQEWKAALDQLDGLSGVEWVRAYVSANSPSEYSHPVAAEVVARTDAKLTAVADELAATIRKLQIVQAERDEARRSCCEYAAIVDGADTADGMESGRFYEIAMKYMKDRGWDCFKEASG